MAKTKKKKLVKLNADMDVTKNSHSLLVETQDGIATFEKFGSFKAKHCLTKLNTVLPYGPAITLIGIYTGELKIYMPHTNVYSSFVHNYKKLEVTQISFNR